MKTKNLLITASFLMILTSIAAQDFAPIGAKWYYTEQFAFSGDISYLWIESTGDTIIKDKNCRILENNGGLACAFGNEKDFVYYEDSTAYFYVPAIDSFQVLYDLRAEKDSSWTVVFQIDSGLPFDTLEVSVDSVSTVIINSKEFKKLHVTYNYVKNSWGQNYTGEIIERIGDIYYLFHLYTQESLCDVNYSGGLRCYEDEYLGFYSTGIADSCTYEYEWTGIDNKNTNSIFKIYPNPTTDIIEIKCKIQSDYKIVLFDVTGYIILSEDKSGDSSLNLSGLSNGVYILQVIKKDRIYSKMKIVKN